MSIISIVDKSRSLSIKFDTNQSTNIGNAKKKKQVYGGRQGYGCQAQFNEAGLALPILYFSDFTL